MEGKIKESNNSVQGLLNVRNLYKKAKKQYEEGNVGLVNEWVISNMDGCVRDA